MHSDGIYLEPQNKNDIELKSRASFVYSKDLSSNNLKSHEIEFKTQESYGSDVPANNQKFDSNSQLIAYITIT